jgi:hypothetical protein
MARMTTPTPKPAISPSLPPPPIRAPDLGQGLTTVPDAYPNLRAPFPDGKIPCSQFPSDFAVRVPWQNMGGWASVVSYSGQNAEGRLLGLANQVNKTCFSGTFCGYNCPDGMLPGQWPVSRQGAGGESVGGLECKNDLLYLTRPEVTQNLCIDGSDQATALIVNNLDKVVSICATNYPGRKSIFAPDIPNIMQAQKTRPCGKKYFPARRRSWP